MLFLAETRLEPRRKRVNAKRVKFPTRVTTDGHKSGSRGDKFAMGCSIRVGPIQPRRPTLNTRNVTHTIPSLLIRLRFALEYSNAFDADLSEKNTASMQSFSLQCGRSTCPPGMNVTKKDMRLLAWANPATAAAAHWAAPVHDADNTSYTRPRPCCLHPH